MTKKKAIRTPAPESGTIRGGFNRSITVTNGRGKVLDRSNDCTYKDDPKPKTLKIEDYPPHAVFTVHVHGNQACETSYIFY
jgi:hypothetical protein